MNANRYVLRPPMTGPCRASPVHSSLGRAASNRPNTGGGLPSGRVRSSRRTKWRCRVRSDGDQPAAGAQDPGDLGCGAGRVLPLQRRGQGEHLGRGAGSDLAGRGHQRIEPARPPGADPPVQAGPRHPDRLPERAGMRAGGELADQPARAAGYSAQDQLPHGSASTGTAQPRGPDPHGGLLHHLQRSWVTSRTRQKGIGSCSGSPCWPTAPAPSPDWC